LVEKDLTFGKIKIFREAMKVPPPLFALLVAVLLVLAVSVASAQTETTTVHETTVTITTTITNTTITTTEVKVIIQNVTVFRFNVTTLFFGFVNESTMIVSYTCMYEESCDECIPLLVKIYNDAKLAYEIDFTDFEEMCTVESICSDRVFIDVSGFTRIHVEVYDAETMELLGEFDAELPYAGPKLTGYLQLLYPLVTIGIIVGLAARGSTKTTAIGFIVAGVALLVLPYIGIYPPNMYALFVFSIIIGVILLWFSER